MVVGASIFQVLSKARGKWPFARGTTTMVNGFDTAYCWLIMTFTQMRLIHNLLYSSFIILLFVYYIYISIFIFNILYINTSTIHILYYVILNMRVILGIYSYRPSVPSSSVLCPPVLSGFETKLSARHYDKPLAAILEVWGDSRLVSVENGPP